MADNQYYEEQQAPEQSHFGSVGVEEGRWDYNQATQASLRDRVNSDRRTGPQQEHIYPPKPSQDQEQGGRKRKSVPSEGYSQSYNEPIRNSSRYNQYSIEAIPRNQYYERGWKQANPNQNRTSQGGGYGDSSRDSRYDDTNTAVSSQDIHHQRKQIRKRVKQKRKHAAPMIRWTKFMHSNTKNHIVATLGEFIGTTMFLFFAFAGTQAANFGQSQQLSLTPDVMSSFNAGTVLFISLSFGFSLMVNAWVFFRISGGLFNPAVTLALTLTRDVPPFRSLLIFIAQLTGACFSAYLVQVMFPTPLAVTTGLSNGTTLAQGVFIEAVCTFELIFTILMLAKEKHRATFIAPIGIGLALFVAELTAVFYTGGSLNPARSFGPAAVLGTFGGDHWVYWVGPLLGSLVATGLFKLFKALEYELVNPGQDGDEGNDPTRNEELEVARLARERAAEVEEFGRVEQSGGGLDSLSESGSGSVGAGERRSEAGEAETSVDENLSQRPLNRRRELDVEEGLSQTSLDRGGEMHVEAQGQNQDDVWTTIRR